MGLETPFIRPSKLAQDVTPSLPVIQHAVKKLYEIDKYIPEIIVNLQPTSPFRNGALIDKALNIFIDSNEADSLVSVEKIPHNYSPFSALKYDGKYLRPLERHGEKYNNRNRC